MYNAVVCAFTPSQTVKRLVNFGDAASIQSTQSQRVGRRLTLTLEKGRRLRVRRTSLGVKRANSTLSLVRCSLFLI